MDSGNTEDSVEDVRVAHLSEKLGYTFPADKQALA